MNLPYLKQLRPRTTNMRRGFGMAGKAGVQFFTQIKTITQQWKESPAQRVSLSMPTSQK